MSGVLVRGKLRVLTVTIRTVELHTIESGTMNSVLRRLGVTLHVAVDVLPREWHRRLLIVLVHLDVSRRDVLVSLGPEVLGITGTAQRPEL